jgi:nucleotide-binding universal stress UspA family protein
VIRVVLVRLTGRDPLDSQQLAAASELAQAFDAHITGLYINVLPAVLLPADAVSAQGPFSFVAEAREAGDVIARSLAAKLDELDQSAELRRFDVFGEDVQSIFAREARAADVYVSLRPRGDKEGQDIVEAVLFRGGRHVLLVDNPRTFSAGFEHAVIAWNGSREAARALSEARPYLTKARNVTVMIVEKGVAADLETMTAEDVVNYLGFHGVQAQLRRIEVRKSVSETIIEEVAELRADLLIMGGYGSSRLAEWLLGGTTRKLLRQSPVPLLIAH